jgi:hypothetical protein
MFTLYMNHLINDYEKSEIKIKKYHTAIKDLYLTTKKSNDESFFQ